MQRLKLGAAMLDKPERSRGENLGATPDGRARAERVRELTWALIDEQINEDELKLLDTLLLSDEKARDNYIGCVQMHAELLAHFATPAKKTGSKVAIESAVLGFLDLGLPPLGYQSPSRGEATQ
jgi:hypothetical protein